MRNLINTDIANVVSTDRQDRTNVAGVDSLRAHRPLRLRLHARRALENTAAYLSGGKRLAKPVFPGAMRRLERSCSSGSGSQSCWRSMRQPSPAFANIG